MKMFRGMILALIPATLLAVYFFREKAVLLILVSVAVAVGSEALFQFIFNNLAENSPSSVLPCSQSDGTGGR